MDTVEGPTATPHPFIPTFGRRMALANLGRNTAWLRVADRALPDGTRYYAFVNFGHGAVVRVDVRLCDRLDSPDHTAVVYLSGDDMEFCGNEALVILDAMLTITQPIAPLG